MSQNTKQFLTTELWRLLLKNKERQKLLKKQKDRALFLSKSVDLQLFRNKLTMSTIIRRLTLSRIKLTRDKKQIRQLEKFIDILKEISYYGRNISLTVSTRGLSFWQIKMIQLILDGRMDDLRLIIEREQELIKLAQERSLGKEVVKNEKVYDSRDLRTESADFLSLNESHLVKEYDGNKNDTKSSIKELLEITKKKAKEYRENL